MVPRYQSGTKTVPKWGLSCGHENGSTLEQFRLHFFLSVHARQYYPSDLNFVYDKISQSFALGVPRQGWLTKKLMYCTCSGCVSISIQCLPYLPQCSACTAIPCMVCLVLLVYEKHVADFIFCSWTVLIIRPQQYWFYAN